MTTTDAPTAGPTPLVERTKFTPGWPGFDGYPKADSYTWGQFAGWAIELGGYGDISAVSPYTGARLAVLPDHTRTTPASTFDMLRELIDAMEAHAREREAAGDDPDEIDL